MKTDNVIQDKSYAFALKIIELHTRLIETRNFELGSQVLKSGTSMGANVEELLRIITAIQKTTRSKIGFLFFLLFL